MTKSSGVFSTGRPAISVATHAKICTPLGMVIMKLTRETNDSATWGRPVTNMWWVHTPNPMSAVAISATTIQV